MTNDEKVLVSAHRTFQSSDSNLKPNMPRSGSDILIDALLEENVEYIFGYPGGAVLPLYDSIYDDRIPHILYRHEQGAVHAAEGYARVSGKPGVVIVTSGPGATNTLTGIADAYSDSLPLVVFTGQVAKAGIGKDAFQEADLLSMTTPITKHNYQVNDVKDIPKIVKEAFYIANSGRKGPVVIDFPKDMGILTTDKTHDTTIHTPGYDVNLTPTTEEIQKVIDFLNTAEKPLVLAGAGVNFSKANSLLQTFVERNHIPVVTTLHGLGAIPYEHPLFLGMGGMHGSYASNMAITECDLLINFGSRFDDRLASQPKTFAENATIIHVDIDASEINKVINTHLGIVADVRNVLEALLNQTPCPSKHRSWLRQVEHYKAKHPFKYLQDDHALFCRPQRAIEYIGEITNGRAYVATDVGQHQMWVAQFYPFRTHGQFITSGGLGTMGFGIPAAIGAQFAKPKETVVAFVGDGGFQMTNQELALLKAYQLNIKVVLINNGTLGMVKQWQDKFFKQRFSHSVFNDQPNFVKLVEAYGVKTFLIDDPSHIERTLEDAFNYEGPAFIEIRISPEEPVLPMVPSGKANHEMEGLL